MTVPSQTSRDQQVGNGVTLVFTVPFRILDETHLRVLLTVGGVTTEQVLTTNYSVSGVGGANTTVTFVVAPVNDSKVTFLRNVPFTQETDYVPNDPFPAESHERALDKLTMQVQQLNELAGENGRVVKIPPEVSGVSTELPIPVASGLWGWNAAADAPRYFTAAEIGTTLAFSNFIADTFTAIAAQTEFTLTEDPGALANLDVSIDGVTQVPTTDYSLDGTTLTFTAAMAGGEKVLARYGTALPNGVSDSSAVNFTADGAGAVQRTVSGRLSDTVSVLDYIPVVHHAAIRARTSTFDCSDAFQNAWTEMIARGGTELHVPAGLYIVGRATGYVIDYNGSLGTANNRGFSIFGDGDGATTIRIVTANGFFKWVSPAERNVRMTIRNLMVQGGIATASSLGTVWHLESPVGGNHHHRDLIVENVTMDSRGGHVDAYWDTAFYCKALWRPYFHNVAITGPFGGSVNQYAGTACIDTPECYGPELADTHLWGCQYGFRFISLEVEGGEGGGLTNVVLDSVIGAYVESLGVEPAFDARRVHTNCEQVGLWIKKRKLVKLCDSIVYNENATAYSDIKLEQCDSVDIDNYTFFFGGNTNRINVDVDALCTNIAARNCRHVCDGTGYKLASGADQIMIDKPHFDALIDTPISDLGATNLYVKQRTRQHARMTLAVAQSIPNGANTTVAWDTESIDVGAWAAGAGTTFTVPANRGIRRVRLTANIAWANNSTGVRQAFFRKGGASFAGEARVDVNASGLTHMNLISPIISCTDGDTFTVVVLQSSGVALNLGGTNGAWFAIEAVD